MRAIYSVMLAAVLITIAACGSDGPTQDRRVGDLSDRTWAGLLDKPPRISASGKSVRMQQFKGSFIWADYAAPWCSTCGKQRREVHKAERALGSELVFLTVMTSDMDGYGDPATQATAKAWAKKGTNPDRVVAADLTWMTIPRHVLFSPGGQMLFERTGFMSADEIRQTIKQHRTHWQASQGNTRANASP